MPIVSHIFLRELICNIFEKSGAPPDEAKIVSDHLADANLVGHDSHGVIRAVVYARGMRGVTPYANYEIIKETPAAAVIDAHGGLGIVAALKAMEMAIEKARQNTFGAVGVHHQGHAGRLGDFPPRAAKEGMIGIALLNGGAKLMNPFGGYARRLPPNPLSIALPRKNGEPLMLDITMSVVAGGKVDLKRARGEQMPQGWMIDREGKPVTDPNQLRAPTHSYHKPCGGENLSFGRFVPG